ncbi:MAG: YCF48-related protein, partial [Myxococcota bacterium]
MRCATVVLCFACTADPDPVTDAPGSPLDTATPAFDTAQPVDTGSHVLPPPGPWTWANPTPFGSQLVAVAWAGSDVAWAVGPGLSVLRSEDGAETWHVQSSVFEAFPDRYPAVRLEQLAAPSAEEAWFVGDRGLVGRTVDGGTTWTDRSVDTSAHLYDLHVFDPERAIVVGQGGAAFETRDGGLSWIPLTHPAGDADLRVVGFVDDATGWIGGEDTAMWRTTDGGA